ncbi:MAG: hypothetical protein HRU47_00785 [Verrucomicrobiales bacterium]|nr:hypothetical protein [Verrucomicrobiales bacterium]
MACQKNRLIGLNTIGLRRAGIDTSTRIRNKELLSCCILLKTSPARRVEKS